MTPLDLKRFGLFADLVEADLDLLADLMDSRSLLSGQQLFREGQEAEGLVMVMEGRVRLESSRAGVIGSVQAGETIGAASLVSVGMREITAVAEQPTEIQVLSREGFHRFVEDAPRSAARVLEALGCELAGILRGGLDHVT